MISSRTIELLSGHRKPPADYVPGCPMRRQREADDLVLARAGRGCKVADDLEVEEVVVADRRYVVCNNPDEAGKHLEAREAAVAELGRLLADRGTEAVIGNRNFAPPSTGFNPHGASERF